MRTSKTFSVVFWINQKKAKNNECIVFARITIDKKRLAISLKRRVPVDLWNAQTKRLNGNSFKAREINKYLDQVHAHFFQIYQDLKFQGELITTDLVKARFLGESTDNDKTLQELFTYHHGKIANTLAPGSIKNFAVTEGYINKFLNSKLKTTDIFLSRLNYQFISDFEWFLSEFYPKGHPKAMSHNTIMKHIQRLRKIITLAYHLEWLDKDPFRRWKSTFEKKEREFLSPTALSNLETAIMPGERLDRIRDLFVFSCYTGISYADLVNLTADNITFGMDGEKWIVTRRQKTKTAVKIPLLEPALRIVEKYENHPINLVAGTLLPVPSNVKVNQFLKEVALICGIKKNLTFHMARHTFATTVTLSNGVPIETVSKMLGHTKIATTQIYARVLENKVSKDMGELKAILGKKKQKGNMEKKKL